MLKITLNTSCNVAALIVLLLLILNTGVSFVLHKKREIFFKENEFVVGYIALIPFIFGFLVGITFLFSYVLIVQAFTHIIDKIFLMHLIYLLPLLILSLYMLLKSWFFRMKLENGFLIIRNAFGMTSKYQIYQIKYQRKSLFTILYINKKRRILIQLDYVLYHLDSILNQLLRKK